MMDPMTTIWPTLTYADAPAAIDFLVTAFGFVEAARYDGAVAGTVDHAQLAWPGGGGVMLSTARSGGDLADLPVGTGSVYVVVDDPDGLHARATDAGAVVVRGLREEDHGSRGFTVRDPEGVFWSFGTYAGQQAGG